MDLKTLAETAEYMYFQDYPDRDAFFDKESFKFQAAIAYSQMLDAGFQKSRIMSKQEFGVSVPEISASWLISEPYTVQLDTVTGDYFAETKQPIFSFNYDSFGYGVQRVTGSGNCKKMQKISNDEWNFTGIVPLSSFCFYTVGGANRVDFKDDVKPGYIWYVPVVVGNDDNQQMSDSMAPEVIKQVLTVMFGAKNGNVVKETDDGNKNAQPQTQQNTSLLK